MTAQMPVPAAGDPVAVILARMEVKLDAALAEQARHSTIIDRHDKVLGEHANRLTALETRDQADSSHQAQTISAKQVMWAAVAAIAAIAAVIVALTFH